MATTSRAHQLMMADYRTAEQAWLERREAETALYPAEVAAFDAVNPRPTLKEFLVDRRQTHWTRTEAA